MAWAPPVADMQSASISDFVGPKDELSSVIQVLGWLVFGLQLSSSMNPIVFKLNNYIISIFWAYGSYVGFFWDMGFMFRAVGF